MVAVLATFRRVKIRAPGISIDVSSGEAPQFEETQDAPAATPYGYYCQHVFEMKNYSGAFTTRERGMFGLHYVNSTGGSLDTTWVTADFAAAETAVQSFFTTNAAYFSTSCRLVEHRWYAFGPEVVKPNPPVRVTTPTPIAGSVTGPWVHQVATTATLRTALRKHWGRIYLPTQMQGVYTQEGQMPSGIADSLATAVRTMLLAAETSQGVVPVVWDRTRKLAYTMTQIEIDSVPDIIRRRRPRDTGYKKIISA